MAGSDDTPEVTKDAYSPRSASRFGGPNSRAGSKAGASSHEVVPPPSDKLRNALRLDTEGKRRARFRKRGWLILLAAAPLVFGAFKALTGGDAVGMAINLGLFGLFGLSAYLIREGGEAEDAYEDRKYASAPALPRKLIGSALLGGALTLTGLLGWDIGWIQSIGLGLLGAAASVLTFGVDPMRSKGEISLSGVTPQMVEEAIREAEEKIEGIERAAADVADSPLRDRLAGITARARDILKRIEEDPSDLRRARKFLKVYLDGALEATRKYVRSQHDLGETGMYMKFRSLLDDMKATFDKQHEQLLVNDHIDLDVEIDVLAERLNRETVLR